MLHIWGNLYVTVLDKYNFGLIEKGVNKKGEQTNKTIGYFGCLKTLLKKAIEIQIRHKCKEGRMANILTELEAMHKDIEQLNCADLKQAEKGK